MILRVLNLWEKLRSSYWFVPSLLAFVAIGLSFGMAKVDANLSDNFARSVGWIYSGGPEGARGVLSAISSSVIGVAGTTFSITIAVLSLTSGQYGPRLLRGFMRDTGNQVVLGTFTATYLYCLLVLRTIRGTERTTYVPHLSVSVGVLLAILSVAVLIYFVHHVAESIHVTHIIESVGRDADEAVGRLFPKEIGEKEGEGQPPTSDAVSVRSRSVGYVESVDAEALLSLAQRHGLTIRVEARPGEYVMPDGPLLSVWPAAGGHEPALRRAFSIGRQRTTLQDAEFCFLQLSEVAVRALSPGINDPFTAMQCLDRITAAMCLLAPRHWPSACRYDEQGALRLIAKPVSPEAIVEAAYGHIRQAAKDSPAVLARLRQCLEIALDRAEQPGLRQSLREELSRL